MLVPLLDALQHIWSLFEAAVLPLLDRRGVDPNLLPELRDSVVQFLHAVKETRINGRRVLSLLHVTQTFHALLHLPNFVMWWGNLWEHWCFVFERIAGVVTTALRGYNHRAKATGVGAWLCNRLMINEVSKRHETSAEGVAMHVIMMMTVHVHGHDCDDNELVRCTPLYTSLVLE